MSTATAAVTGRHLIAGRWLTPAGRTFESHNPARTQEVVGVFPTATAAEADAAVTAAPAASTGPSCSTTSPSSSSATPTRSPN